MVLVLGAAINRIPSARTTTATERISSSVYLIEGTEYATWHARKDYDVYFEAHLRSLFAVSTESRSVDAARERVGFIRRKRTEDALLASLLSLLDESG
mgnify:FL=1